MRIRSQSKLRFAWAFAIFWNLISAPATFLGAVPEIQKGRTIAWVALLFPFVGAMLLIWAVRLTLRWRRFGVSWLDLSTQTVGLGGPLRARLAAGRLPGESAVLLTLSCVNRIVSGSGENRSVREKVVWQEEQTVAREALEPGPEGVVVPVSFRLPADAPPTRHEDSADRILWRLQAKARLAGVDYDEQFEIPVAAAPTGEAASPAPRPAPTPGLARPETSRIVTEPDPEGGTRYVLPPGRNLRATLVALFYAGLFSGMTVLFLVLSRQGDGGGLFRVVFWIMAMILVPFSLIIVLVTLHTSRLSTIVTVGSEGVAIRSRLLGLSWVVKAPRQDVKDVALHVGMQVGMVPYYDLKIARLSGRPLTISAMLRDKREAEWLAAQITQALR